MSEDKEESTRSKEPKRQKVIVPDETLLRYGHFIEIYEKSGNPYKEFLKSYDSVYEKIYQEQFKLYVDKCKTSFNKKEDFNKLSTKSELDEYYRKKKNYFESFIPQASQHAQKKAAEYMENSKVEPKKERYYSQNYEVSLTYGNAYIEAKKHETKRPAGWKLHLSIDKDPVNLNKAWDILIPIILKYSLSYLKVSQPVGNPRSGTEIVIYQCFDLDKDWGSIINEIETQYRGNIKPSGFAQEDRRVPGSSFISYRNDFIPPFAGERERTFRPENIEHLIKTALNLIKEKKKEEAYESLPAEAGSIG